MVEELGRVYRLDLHNAFYEMKSSLFHYNYPELYPLSAASPFHRSTAKRINEAEL